MFSLEGDDGGKLFITQTPCSEKNESSPTCIIGDGFDFKSRCQSLLPI